MRYKTMKRALLMCLSVILILGVAPVAFAETTVIPVAVTGETLVEGEDYPDNAHGTIDGAANEVRKQIKTDSSASGGEYLFSDNYGSGSNKTHYWAIDFKIPVDGTYTVKTRIGKVWKSRMHDPVKATFGDAVIVQWKWSDRISDSSEVEELAECEAELQLTKGTYTFKLETAAGFGGNHHLYIDYVSVTTKEISETAASVGKMGATLEIEDYPVIKKTLSGTATTAGGEIVSGSAFSNNQYLRYNEEASGAQTAAWERKVDISETGEYTLEYYIRRNASKEGKLTLLLDGTKIHTINEGTQGWERISLSQYLTAGEHTLSIQSYSGSEKAQIFADYIKIRPVTNVSADAQRYEFEDYAGTYSMVTEIDEASEGAVVSGYTKTDHSYKIPVSISESGYYDVLYVVNHNSGNSKVKFSLNLGSEFSLPFTNETPEGTDLDYSGSSYRMSLYEYNGMWINKEEYILETFFENNTDGYISYQLDYIEFKPSEPPAITQSSVSKIEFETYTGPGVYDWDRGITEVSGTSGDKVIYSEWSDIDPSWSFPVSVKDSGFYHINYVVGDYTDAWLSKMTLKLGKILIGTNYMDYVENYGNLVWSSQPLCRYSTEWVWLDKGEYELSVEVSPEQINNVYKYQADYVEFIPAVNGISMEEGLIKVHAAYTDVTSGKVLMALYNGNKLVATTTYLLQNETYVDFEYAPQETVTKVKVFIWNDDNTATPKELSKNFDLTENN